MAVYFAPDKYKRPNKFEGLNELFQGLFGGIQNRRFGQDVQNLQGLDPGQGLDRFNPQSQQMQQLMAQMMMQQQAASQTPITPYQQAGLGIQQQQADTAEQSAGIVSPTQQIAQEKLNRIKLLQEQEADGTITPSAKAELDKLRGGASPVSITMGMPASAAERTAIAGGRASLDALDNLKTLFDSPRTSTGPIVGRTSPILGLVGMTTDEQEAFMAATSAFRNHVIKEITGAQMSEPEAKRIMKQIPEETDPPTRWKAKYEQTKRNLESIQKRREEVLRQSGIRVPESSGTRVNVDEEMTGMSDAELRAIISAPPTTEPVAPPGLSLQYTSNNLVENKKRINPGIKREIDKLPKKQSDYIWKQVAKFPINVWKDKPRSEQEVLLKQFRDEAVRRSK